MFEIISESKLAVVLIIRIISKVHMLVDAVGRSPILVSSLGNASRYWWRQIAACSYQKYHVKLNAASQSGKGSAPQTPCTASPRCSLLDYGRCYIKDSRPGNMCLKSLQKVSLL